MKILPLLIGCVLLVSACDENGKDEIYNENNTSVSGGIVYNIEEEPIDGIYKVYYPDGELKMEVQSKNGKPNGIGKFYTEDGMLYFQGNFADGKPNGVLYNYYPDGQIHNEMSYKDGIRDGSQKVYDEDGNLLAEIMFDNGEPVSGYTIVNEEKTALQAEELTELK